MFNFHKPKIYRSNLGCCICRAKSSSSRFTDSKKYEPEFEKCFRTAEKRSGEICNACVLLVKRWKKLPTGTNRNWQHVVDARAGPGTKSFKCRNNPHMIRNEGIKKKIAKDIRSITSSESESDEEDEVADEEVDDGLEDGLVDSGDLADETSPAALRRSTRLAKTGGVGMVRGHSANGKRRKSIPKKLSEQPFYSFIDPTFWQREEVCCGIIFKGPNDAILMMAPKMITPCRHRHTLKQKQQEAGVGKVLATGVENFTEPGKKTLRHQDSFTTSHSTDSILSDVASNGHDELIDDHSSGISSMAMCEDSDRMSTVSSSVMDVDDANSCASDVFDHHVIEMGKPSSVSPLPTLSVQAVI